MRELQNSLPEKLMEVWNKSRGTMPKVVSRLGRNQEFRKKVELRRKYFALKAPEFLAEMGEIIKAASKHPFYTGRETSFELTLQYLVHSDNNIEKVATRIGAIREGKAILPNEEQPVFGAEMTPEMVEAHKSFLDRHEKELAESKRLYEEELREDKARPS